MSRHRYCRRYQYQLQKQRRLYQLFSRSRPTLNYLVQRSTQEQAATLTDDDFFLRPDVGQMETIEFDKMPTAYHADEATRQYTEQLSKLSLSNADYQHYIDDKQKARKAAQAW